MLRRPETRPGHPGRMSENSIRHADASWPHPGSEAARTEGRFVPAPRTGGTENTDGVENTGGTAIDSHADGAATMRD